MPVTRYILMDNSNGRIWGDTADLDGPARDETPAQAAERLDRFMGDESQLYIEQAPSTALTGVDGYIVYAAAPDFPLVTDGENQAVIDHVIAACEAVAFVEVQDKDEPETPPSP
jgi:hypothetical protein